MTRKTLTLEEFVEEFHQQAASLVAAGDCAALKDLFARWSAAAQIFNKTHEEQAREGMKQALRDALLEPSTEATRAFFDDP